MKNTGVDIYFLLFGSMFLFILFVLFIIVFFTYYRKKRREHFHQAEEMEKKFEEELLRSKLEVQEQVFNYISQEIHDNVGQVLSTARIQANIISQTSQFNEELIDNIKQNISTALSDLRDIARSLSSDRIKSLSILNVMTAEIERLNKFADFKTTLSTEGTEKPIEETRKLFLFRILQEALQNIIRHSEASNVVVTFYYLEKIVKVIVEDDGKGFDSVSMDKTGPGIGMMNIKSRVAFVCGSFNFFSAVNQGTKLLIEIPYE